MLIAAAAEIEIAATMGVVKQHIGIDNGIIGREDGTVHQVHEGTFRSLAHRHTYLEVLSFVSGIVSPVGAEEHIVFPIALVYLRCPEAILAPLVAITAVIYLSAGFPVDEVVTHESLKTISQGSAIHVISAVGGMQEKWVAQLHGQGIAYVAGYARFLLKQTA